MKNVSIYLLGFISPIVLFSIGHSLWNHNVDALILLPICMFVMIPIIIIDSNNL